jgi:hypothetical protein
LVSVPAENSFISKFQSRIWIEKNSKISSQINLGQFHPSKVRGNLKTSNPLLRMWPQATVSHAAVDGGGEASEVVPMQCTQSEKPLYDITLGSPPLDV